MPDQLLKILFPPFPDYRASAGLLFMRILLGFGILLHGIGKIPHAEGFAAGVGVPIFMAWLAIFAEVVGGAMVLAGALTPLFAALLTINMSVAVLHHIRGGDGFLVGPNGQGGYTTGWEFAALYLVGFAAVLLAGPGRFSLDWFLLGRRRGVA